jgi:hypothetical protein
MKDRNILIAVADAIDEPGKLGELAEQLREIADFCNGVDVNRVLTALRRALA